MTYAEFREKLKASPLPVVVDLWAPWCMPCRAIAPSLERLKKDYHGRVDLWKINADENPEVLRGLGVYGIPTVLAFGNGEEIARRTGAQPQAGLAELFDAALEGKPPVKSGLAPTDRLLRLTAGMALAGIGVVSGPSLLLVALGGLVLFSGIYDRCPIWKALAPHLAKLLKLTP